MTTRVLDWLDRNMGETVDRLVILAALLAVGVVAYFALVLVVRWPVRSALTVAGCVGAWWLTGVILHWDDARKRSDQ